METLTEIKNNYAQEQGYEDWDDLSEKSNYADDYELHWTSVCIRAQKAALEKAAEKYDWINVADKLPLTLPRPGWDGKVSDLVLMRNSEGRIFVGHFNDGFMDGSEFNDWYEENEFTVHGINYWCEIPDFHSTSITNPEKEKTFDELALELASVRFWENGDDFVKTAANLMQQVREATISEIESKANEYGEFGTADYVHEMPTDRIKLTKKK